MTTGVDQPTYRDLLSSLCVDAEADYFLYRLSDPTCVLVEALLDALGRGAGPRPGGPPAAANAQTAGVAGRSNPPGHAASCTGRALDLCGGSGHLTRILLRQPFCTGAVLADVHFWKLWLAARILAPDCEPVCCDANSPLPFADDRFATVLLSDAFPYIWHKRLLAGEMQRVANGDGVIVMPHLHSAHGDNYSAGDTLSPTAYSNLFAPLRPRLFDDRILLDGVLKERVVDLANQMSPAGCGDTPSITLVATRDAELYRCHDVPDRLDATGLLAVNPPLPRGVRGWRLAAHARLSNSGIRGRVRARQAVPPGNCQCRRRHSGRDRACGRRTGLRRVAPAAGSARPAPPLLLSAGMSETISRDTTGPV